MSGRSKRTLTTSQKALEVERHQQQKREAVRGAKSVGFAGMYERHASQVVAGAGKEASDIDDEVTEVAAPPQKKARQSKKWNPYKNLVLASAGEFFSAQLKSSNTVEFLWPYPLIAAARVVSTAGVSVISRVGDFCVLRFYICIYRYGSSFSVYSTLWRIVAAVSHTTSFTC